MARHSIVEKLQRELEQEITTERQVVYILAEARKLLEVTGRRDDAKYFALYFHCSWALHTSMRREGAARILERFDTAHGEAVKTPGVQLHELPKQIRDTIYETMLYEKLRDQLEALFTDETLPTHLTSDAYRWGTFMSLFTEVIEECPLELSKVGIQLKHVEGVTVTKLRNLPLEAGQGNIVLFGTKWKIHTINKKDRAEWNALVVIATQPTGARIVPVPTQQ